MTRKLIALTLVFSMMLGMFTACANKQRTVTTINEYGYDITVIETDNKRETSTTTDEGVFVKCEHIFSSDEYYMYLNDNPIQLDVVVYDDRIEVFFPEEITSTNYEEKVIGQMALTASIAAPTLISCAKTLVAICVLGYATKSVYVSADALGGVISGVRYNSNTYRRYRTIDIAAADAIRFGRLSRYNAYYSAYLSGNTVMVGQEINEWTAVWRLKNGYDVFATGNYAAFKATYQAAIWTGKGGVIQHSYIKNEGYYPHYHPVGRKWINNPSSYPHCWYPI